VQKPKYWNPSAKRAPRAARETVPRALSDGSGAQRSESSLPMAT
jgi:hypothetical protein